METYIVRIYRKGATASDGIAGMVEDVARQKEKGFSTPAELCRILDLRMGNGSNGNRENETPGNGKEAET
ncbi:MAG: hypothetical protein FD174_107 [Geobacteraceae bacterium]|nr:MAG: hypothetical protein FD174_107 [Geobacteraceae bacterium]